MKQQTLNTEFSLSGKGLHTGKLVTARFIPSEVNTGIRITRIDLDGQPCFEALADYVSSTERGTVLKKDDWQISTIEHAMSALAAMGVDNCLIEVDGPEMPILDGSAMPFIEKIQQVGVKEQDQDANVLVVRRKIELENNGSKIMILPDDSFSLDVMISFQSPVLNNQFATLDDINDYPTQIAPARTFCFVREIRPLLDMGLIKGGDLQNALVIYDEQMTDSELDALSAGLGQPQINASKLGYLSELKYDNEPARHKLLDLLGDLALLGCRLQGKIIATRPGHTINTAFCRLLRKELRAAANQAPIITADTKPIMENVDIRKLLPHRFPMLLVDKVYKITDTGIIATKNFTNDEPFFQGHFPQEPVVPGVLLLEAMAQAGGVLVLGKEEDPTSFSTYFMKIDKAKFRRKIIPGDTFIMRLEFLAPPRRGIIVMRAEGFVGNQLAVEAELTAQIVKNN